MERGFSFSTDIKIRFSETYMYGHVNNISPFIYFEEARTDYFSSLEHLNDEEVESMSIVADLQCNFHKEIYFGNKLRVYVKVESAGTSSIDTHYLAFNEKEEVCLTGQSAIVNINSQSRKAMPINKDLKKAFLNEVSYNSKILVET